MSFKVKDIVSLYIVTFYLKNKKLALVLILVNITKKLSNLAYKVKLLKA